MNSLRADVEEALKIGFHELDKDRLAKLFQAVFSVPLDIDCHKCIYKARILLRKWLENSEFKIEIMSKLKQRVKPEYMPVGGEMRVNGYPKVMTTENLTQTDIDWLKANGREKMIEDVPADVKVEDKGKK